MSTATAFKYQSAFPFCATDISAEVGSASYVGNLTLTQVMAVAWNIENLAFATVGSATITGTPPDPDVTVNGAMSFALNPLACNRVDRGRLTNVSMWFGNTLSPDTVWASWPAFRDPDERVCYPYEVTNKGCLVEMYGDNLSGNQDMRLHLYVGTDPSNAGKYRLYYNFYFHCGASGAAGLVDIAWTSGNTPFGYTDFSSGTVTIAGISLNWRSYYTTGATPSGSGALTLTASSFTY